MNAYAQRTAARLLACAALTLCAPWACAAPMFQASDDPATSPVWLNVRASLFEGRAIAKAPEGALVLDVPARAIDAAVVPIAIRTNFPQSPGAPARHVAKLYLIIDANPSPISAIFQFTPLSGRADIETRVRIDEYTHVRAIAETSDGQLFMATRFLKAAGGCSAPPGKDAQAALATLGRMKFRVEGGTGASCAAALALAAAASTATNSAARADDRRCLLNRAAGTSPRCRSAGLCSRSPRP